MSGAIRYTDLDIREQYLLCTDPEYAVTFVDQKLSTTGYLVWARLQNQLSYLIRYGYPLEACLSIVCVDVIVDGSYTMHHKYKKNYVEKEFAKVVRRNNKASNK